MIKKYAKSVQGRLDYRTEDKIISRKDLVLCSYCNVYSEAKEAALMYGWFYPNNGTGPKWKESCLCMNCIDDDSITNEEIKTKFKEETTIKILSEEDL